MPFKTTLNWLFNDIGCHLVIGSFDCKICIFQQTVVRGLLYPQPYLFNKPFFLHDQRVMAKT